jgi:hypothetical protein
MPNGSSSNEPLILPAAPPSANNPGTTINRKFLNIRTR